MVRTLYNNISERWSLDVFHTDRILFSLGAICVHACNFSHFMGCIMAHPSDLPGTLLMFISLKYCIECYSISYNVSLLVNISELSILCIFNHDANELLTIRTASVNEEVREYVFHLLFRILLGMSTTKCPIFFLVNHSHVHYIS